MLYADLQIFLQSQFRLAGLVACTFKEKDIAALGLKAVLGGTACYANDCCCRYSCSMINMNAKYRETIEAVAKQIPFEPKICIVLGSGLGDFANKVETVKSISTTSFLIILNQQFKVIKVIFIFKLRR